MGILSDIFGNKDDITNDEITIRDESNLRYT